MTLPDDTREKSVLLARVMGMYVEEWPEGQWWIDPDGERNFISNLYDPANMQFAWRVLNWAQQHFDRTQRRDLTYTVMRITLPPAQAQAAWLDKVLQLAIEAGLVTEDGTRATLADEEVNRDAIHK